MQWFQSREKSKTLKPSKGQVVLFPDTFTNYNQPKIGQAATILLENMGYQVIIPKFKCCGRPTLSKGPIDKTIINARFNVDSIFPYINNVGIETATYTDSIIDGWIDRFMFHNAFKSKAAELGAEFTKGDVKSISEINDDLLRILSAESLSQIVTLSCIV